MLLNYENNNNLNLISLLNDMHFNVIYGIKICIFTVVF